MKRLNDKNCCEELKGRICRLESDDFRERTVAYYVHAILSIEDARSLLASHVTERPEVSSGLLLRNLEMVLVKQMPLCGYWEERGIVCDREKVIVLALVDILFALTKESGSQEKIPEPLAKRKDGE
jgi:hypothetical protein